MSKNILPTAGAIIVRNEKGELSMEKVKVQRYISGRKPKYADQYSSESEDESFIRKNTVKKTQKKEVLDFVNYVPKKTNNTITIPEEDVKLDRRLQRLQRIRLDDTERQSLKPEIIDDGDADDLNIRRRHRQLSSSDSENETNSENEENVEKRHALLKQRLTNEEQLAKQNTEDEQSEDDEDEEETDESESEEYSSEDDSRIRLKPVFIRKQDRLSLNKQLEDKESKKIDEELLNRKKAEERRKDALKIIEATIIKEREEKDENVEVTFESIASVKTDDESEEVGYLNWKVRELKRNKRDKEEREALIKEKEEIERLRNMTEEERLEELKKNPKKVTNKAEKGKYSFMQKYYHRGAFYLDEEEDIFKRDVSKPTLEDHFDKTVLPKVMQVKNFGRSGRTKYTHLVDQDTTKFDSPWIDESQKNFVQKHGGGLKQVFERPSKKRKN